MAAKKATEVATATTEKALTIDIPKIELVKFQLTVIGDSPLIMHKWSEKAKKEILDKQLKSASKGRERKNPVRDYVNSMYWLNEDGIEIDPPAVKDCKSEQDDKDELERITSEIENAHFGFPACAFKAAAIDAGYQQGAIQKKTTARGAFHITQELVPIEGTPQIREDMVKVGAMTKTADIRYRGEFPTWKATLDIIYNPNSISAEQIANLLNLAGFANGIGEWRPSRNGEFGRFHVQTA